MPSAHALTGGLYLALLLIAAYSAHRTLGCSPSAPSVTVRRQAQELPVSSRNLTLSQLLDACRQTQPSDRTDHGIALRCWIADYAEWHKKQRGTPNARYLIWTCFHPGGNRAADNLDHAFHGVCGGLGDRLRGMEYALRLADATKRVLLIHQETPAPMEVFFAPNAIDWRLTLDLGISITQDTRHLILRDYTPLEILPPTARTSVELLNNMTLHTLEDRVITVSTNYDLMRFSGKDENGVAWDDYFHRDFDLGQVLFKLSAQVDQRVDEVLAELGIGKHEPYLAFHLRLGQLVGESDKLQRTSLPSNTTDEELLTLAHGCARDLIASSAPADGAGGRIALSPKMILITDKTDLRRRAIAGRLAPWVSPNVLPVHHDKHHDASLQQQLVEHHVKSMADFGILMRATCLLRTASGFSQQAFLLGRHECQTTVNRCLGLQD